MRGDWRDYGGARQGAGAKPKFGEKMEHVSVLIPKNLNAELSAVAADLGAERSSVARKALAVGLVILSACEDASKTLDKTSWEAYCTQYAAAINHAAFPSHEIIN